MAKMVNKKVTRKALGQQLHFQAFNPSVYSDTTGYVTNPVFKTDKIHPLTALANRALICISKATPGYEDRLSEKHTYKTAKTKGREKLQGKRHVMNFAPTLLDVEPNSCLAVRIPYSDFEGVSAFCLGFIEDNNRYSNAEALSRALFDEYYEDKRICYTSKELGIEYDRKHILSFFALWNIDRAIQSINTGKARDVAQYLMDAVLLIEQSERIFAEKITSLNYLKKKSEQQSRVRKKGHEKKAPLIQKHIDMFTGKKGKNGKKPWRSINQAISIISSHFNEKISKETLRRRFQQADPLGYLTEYKRKKSV